MYEGDGEGTNSLQVRWCATTPKMASPDAATVRAQVQSIRGLIGDLAKMTHSPGSEVMVGEIESRLATLLETVSGDGWGFADRPPRAPDR